MKNKNYWKELISGVLLMVILTLAWKTCFRKVDTSSRFVIAKAIKLDTIQGAGFVALQYSFLDSLRTVVMPVSGVKVQINDQYFVAVWEDEPGKTGVDFSRKVPPCIDSTFVPKEGWGEIPSCK